MFDSDIAPDDPRLTELRELVNAVARERRIVAQAEAREIRHLARAAELALELAQTSEDADAPRIYGQGKRENYALQQVQAEIGNTIRVSDRTIARRMSDAHALTTEYPRVMQALDEGEISREHATALSDAGIIITCPTLRSAYEKDMLDYAQTASVNRVRQVAKQVAEQYSDRELETRLADAHSSRSIKVQPLDEGLSLITAVVPSLQGAALYDRLSQMAKLVKRANTRARNAKHEWDGDHTPEAERARLQRAASDERTLMQIRTDILLDMALTGFPSTLTCSHDQDAADCTQAYCDRADPSGPSAFVDNVDGADSLALTDGARWDDGSGSTQNSGWTDGPGSSSTDFGHTITNAMLQNISAHVQIVIPVLSLLPTEQLNQLRTIPGFEHIERLSGCNGAPQLAGHGPVPPEVARLLLGTATSWDRLLTDPIDGVVITADQYTPTQSVKRALIARDMHCRFPGCRVPAKHCQIDHTQDWALGGKTLPENLAHLCIRHHNLKHYSDWTVTQGSGGVLEWTSPLGTPFTDEPVSTVMFVAIDTPPDSRSETSRPHDEDEPPPF